MKAIELPVGTRVCLTEDITSKGIVINNTLQKGDEFVAVEWLQPSEYGYPASFYTCDTDVNGLTVLSTILEQDFNVIEQKVNEATALLNEAQDIAHKHNKDLIELNHYDLKRALTNAGFSEGWRSSSYNC